MKLFYLDESGNTGDKRDDPTQPYHLLAAVVADETQVRNVENAVRVLAEQYFPNQAADRDFEFHGYEIHKGKGNYFTGLPVTTRIAIMDGLIGIIAAHQLPVLYALIDKPKCYASQHPHLLAFTLLAERIEDYLRANGALGLLVADENEEIEQRLIDDLDRFKEYSTGFGYRSTKLSCVVDSLHFVKSNNNWLIQLADVAAFALLRGIRTHEALWAQYQAAKPFGTPFDAWATANASPKHLTELRHYQALQPMLRASKRFP